MKPELKHYWPALLPLLCAGLLLIELEYYRPHVDAGFLSVLLSSMSILGIGVALVFRLRKYRRRFLPVVICMIVSALVCGAVLAVAWVIPNCPICEGLTEDDLGLLALWIVPAL